MDRNTTIAFVLIGAILVIWLYMNAPEPVKQKPVQQDSSLVTDTNKTNQLEEKEKIVEPEKELLPQQTINDSLDYGKYFKPSSEKERIITIENENYIIELSTKGANFHKFFLKKYNNWYTVNRNGENDLKKTSVQLINYSLGNTYDLSFVSSDGKAINTSGFVFETDLNSSGYSITDGDSLIVNFTLADGDRKLIKRYIFYGNKYIIRSEIELINMENIISNNAYDLVWSNGLRFAGKNSVDEATYSNPSVYSGGEQTIIDASSVGETEQKDFNGSIDWIAVRNKYFAAVIVPDNPNSVEGAYIEGYSKALHKDGVAEYYNSRLILPFKNTNYDKRTFFLYVGPVDYNSLKELGHNLQALVDFGSFFGLKFIVRPIAEYVLLPLFNFLHSFIPNYGIVIIIFSLIIKIVVHPLTKQSYQSMKKMQLLQPKIQEIKEKYKDDQQKLNKETMKLYQTYGVNPAGGCLPMLLQMPIFIALWGLFRSAIELRQQPFVWWIKDLSQPDVIYDLGFKLPLFGIQQISGLALLMGITTFIQQKMTMKDPKQQAMVYIMPVFLTILFMSFPSGLNLYYFLFNLFSIIQQQYINHKHDGLELVPVKNPGKKKGFMARMMEAAEQQAKTKQSKKR